MGNAEKCGLHRPLFPERIEVSTIAVVSAVDAGRGYSRAPLVRADRERQAVSHFRYLWPGAALFLRRTVDHSPYPGDVGRLPGGATDRLALSEPAGSAFAESRQSRILFVGGLCILATRYDSFVTAFPMVVRSVGEPE